MTLPGYPTCARLSPGVKWETGHFFTQGREPDPGPRHLDSAQQGELSQRRVQAVRRGRIHEVKGGHVLDACQTKGNQHLAGY